MPKVLAWTVCILLASGSCNGQPHRSVQADPCSANDAVCHDEDQLPGLSLLQHSASIATKSSSSTEKHARAAQENQKAKQPYPAGWFGDFSLDETTYSYDGKFANRNQNPEINVMDGWNPEQKNPLVDQVVPGRWFEETRSGGYKQAYQTFYPALATNVAGNGVPTGGWFTGTGGVWQQNYLSPHAVSETGLPAGWFDDSVNQIDGFGRPKLPALGSEATHLYWEQRSVNTTLTCAKPGCTASVSLQAPFDPQNEVYKHCKLSVLFHPTDFDDQYSEEKVSWVKVNNVQVGADCRPFSSGCNISASRPLLPCVDDLHIDTLMPETGVLNIQAQIPEVVDECPYNGNLLSAVPMLTCLVAPKSKGLVDGERAVQGVAAVTLPETCITTMPLQCPTRGCAAEIAIPLASTCAGLGSVYTKCTLSVRVNQTDFDNHEDTPELIEYLKVGGQQVASDLKPGQNPCKAAWQGTPAAPSKLAYTALKDYDVSHHIREGRLVVEGKISQYVDECASNGYLFDALAEVTCSKSPALLSQDQHVVAGEQRKSFDHGSLLKKMLLKH